MDTSNDSGNDAFQSSTIHQPAAQGSQAPPPLATRRFAELTNLVHPTVIQTITQDMKFDYMTPVQAATLDELLPPPAGATASCKPRRGRARRSRSCSLPSRP